MFSRARDLARPPTHRLAALLAVLALVGCGSDGRRYSGVRREGPQDTGTSGPGDAGTHAGSDAGTPPRDGGPITTTCLGAEQYTSIPQIQGPGAESPLNGTTVTTQGVVTAAPFSAALPGFFMQALEDDGDDRTSQGIFVFHRNAAVAPGDVVIVAGRVAEYYALTELTDVSRVDICDRQSPPAAVVVELPLSTGLGLEPLEGMHVRAIGPFFVSDLGSLVRHGEVRVTAKERPHFRYNGTSAAHERADSADLVIDDGSYDPPAGIPHMAGSGDLGLSDRVDTVTGVLVESFYAHRLHPTEPVAFARGAERRQPAPTKQGNLRIAALNITNYYTTLGQWGAQDQAELDRQTAKIVSAIRGMEADIVGLVEVESNDDFTVAYLASAIRAAGGPNYAYVSLPVSFVTMTAILYRPEVVAPANAPRQLGVGLDLFTRPPLVQTFQKGSGTFSVVVAHFRARRCDTGPTGPDLDQGDGKGCFNDRRRRQAEHVAAFLRDLTYVEGTDQGVLVGDLNAYADEEPIGALVGTGLVDLATRFVPGSSRYSFVFDGEAGYLDYAIATPSLAARAVAAHYWHINSDEPAFLDYKSSNPAGWYQADAYRCADHDPVMVDLSL